jgi:hypothetical protein
MGSLLRTSQCQRLAWSAVVSGGGRLTLAGDRVDRFGSGGLDGVPDNVALVIFLLSVFVLSLVSKSLGSTQRIVRLDRPGLGSTPLGRRTPLDAKTDLARGVAGCSRQVVRRVTLGP